MLSTIAFMLRQSRREGISLFIASALGPRDGSLKVYYMKSTEKNGFIVWKVSEYHSVGVSGQ